MERKGTVRQKLSKKEKKNQERESRLTAGARAGREAERKPNAVNHHGRYLMYAINHDGRYLMSAI